MSIDENALGGRLPLYGSEALDPAQKALYDWLMNVAVPWADAADFEARTETGRLIGPFNPALLTPDISTALLNLAVAEQKHTSLSKRGREVVILTVGAVWQAPYELYAHCAVGRQLGLSDDAVRTLAQGQLPQELTDEEAVAHRVACALGRASSKRGALPRGRSNARCRRGYGNRHTHRRLSHRVRNPKHLCDTRALLNA
jgi:4-carboxymuconolactone decarboxylase